MSPLERSLEGDVVVLDLAHEIEEMDAQALQRSGRSARTLLRNGALRITLVTLAPGGELTEHHADGPITVQALAGRIRFTALGEAHDLAPGQILSAAPGVRHAVSSAEGGMFLLTLAIP